MDMIREEYINSIMTNNKLMETKKLIVESKDCNGEKVRMFKEGGGYIVESTWVIKGYYPKYQMAMKRYIELVKELIRENV